MKHLFIALLMAVATLVAPSSAWAQDSVSVVYHIDDADAQGLMGLRNIRNHLDVAPKTKIRVVAHANGVDFLMDGAKDKSGKVEYASLVSALVSRGVVFEVCEITLKNRNLKREQFLLEATFTASGVVRIAELQAREKYAYIKP